jgi:hypothetical protein
VANEPKTKELTSQGSSEIAESTRMAEIRLAGNLFFGGLVSCECPVASRLLLRKVEQIRKAMIPRFPILLDFWLVLVKVACVEIRSALSDERCRLPLSDCSRHGQFRGSNKNIFRSCDRPRPSPLLLVPQSYSNSNSSSNSVSFPHYGPTLFPHQKSLLPVEKKPRTRTIGGFADKPSRRC